MTREEVLEMLLEVLDAPTECRIVVETRLPRTSNPNKVHERKRHDNKRNVARVRSQAKSRMYRAGCKRSIDNAAKQ